MVNESSLKTGKISVMRDSKQFLVKGVLFQLKGCDHPQDNAKASFFLNSKGSILGLSNEGSFVSEFYLECG